MKVKDNLYYCNQCKKVVEVLEDLLFVEDGSVKGFCSEKCIESYYMPLVNHFEALEKNFRKEFELKKENVQDILNQSAYMESVLRKPKEIWRMENELKEEVYSFISHFEDEVYGKFSIIVLCLVFDHQASFILAATASSDVRLISEFQVGELIDSPETYYEKSKSDYASGSDPESESASASEDSEMSLDSDSLMTIENKKSAYLARLLEERSPADVPFENFHLYDDYFTPTVEEPDEVYSHEDEEGDTIYTYIKALERDSISFYYFCICMKFETHWGQDTETVIPIISFPSLDGELYRKYKNGELITGNLKN